MFNKLLSSLPFNPGLIDQVGFYARRLRKETSVRRLGFVFIALTMLVQMFAVIAPPEQSLARAGNDVLPGGVGSQQQMIQLCQQNAYNFAAILKYFSVSCDNLAAGSVHGLKSTDYGNQLYSMGRLPYGKPGETAIPIDNAGTFYMRPLSSWDGGGPSYYTVLEGHNYFGIKFFILFNCGNIVIIGRPAPPAPKCPLDPSIFQIDPRCKPCPYNTSIIESNPACVPPPCPQDPNIKVTDPRCKACPYDTSILKDDPACERCPYNDKISITDPKCKPCKDSNDREDQLACLVLSKSAVNTTASGQNADNTTAAAGDIIDYTLSVENTGKGIVKKFVIQENITDILEYADIVDLHGGKRGQDNVVSWPEVDVLAQTTIKKLITVRTKNPIPQTPVSSSNPGSFDLTMTNVYGNAVNIKLPPTVVKTTEQVVSTLPSTGPGTSLAIGFGITTIIAYFFARSRLMAKELDIVRSEFASGGF